MDDVLCFSFDCVQPSLSYRCLLKVMAGHYLPIYFVSPAKGRTYLRIWNGVDLLT